MNASPGRVESIGDAGTVFLSEALGPLRQWLDNDKVVEIIANGPGELYVEIIGESSMQRVEAREVTVDWLRHLSERVAGFFEPKRQRRASAPLGRSGVGGALSRRAAAGDDEWRGLRDSKASHQGNVARRLPQDGLLQSRQSVYGGRALGPRSRALRISRRRKNRGFYPRRGEASLHHAALWRNVVG